jgi:hypothetical protein
MTRYGIRLISTAGRIISGRTTDEDIRNRWIAEADVDAYDGRGWVVGTRDPELALSWPDKQQAIEFYMTDSKVRPLRADGLPNRPLTAFNVVIEPLPESGRTLHTGTSGSGSRGAPRSDPTE